MKNFENHLLDIYVIDAKDDYDVLLVLRHSQCSKEDRTPKWSTVKLFKC